MRTKKEVAGTNKGSATNKIGGERRKRFRGLKTSEMCKYRKGREADRLGLLKVRPTKGEMKNGKKEKAEGMKKALGKCSG